MEYNVLIVDNEPDFSTLLEMLITDLSKKPVNVAVCRNGTEALDAMKIQEYQLVALDNDMKYKGEGLETLPKIRGLEAELKRSPTPIVMLSASSDNHMETKAMEAGATDFAYKPFDIDTIEALVNKYLP